MSTKLKEGNREINHRDSGQFHNVEHRPDVSSFIAHFNLGRGGQIGISRFQEFLIFCEKNKIETCVLNDVLKLFQLGGEVLNSLDKNGESLLAWILKRGHRCEELFKFCLQNGTNINRLNRNGETVFQSIFFRLAADESKDNSLLKACLYENPHLHFATKDSILEVALYHDHFELEQRRNGENDDMTDYALNSFVYTLFKAGINYPIEEYVNESLHARIAMFLSRRFPSLYDNHPRKHSTLRNKIIKSNIPKEVLQPLLDTTLELLRPCTRPRTLKDICRKRLRAHYPGRNLHRAMSAMLVPKPIKAFVLLEEYNVLEL
ncbi:uncharacterized protein LOC128216755 [Mya arenaria]|uniref:uncharacterized protein LOC128216755 n=1 Tax=Mya arenaria TaxID=6604 RepID=UPI0022E40E2A|nr:uncharacterized protein LOC128216755 [Mya arenaria]XP_052779371.1 uncharacterized protein LOC128216755 [Mya arenaria]XP_052779372.1 uncharacterized protein LOC128216755 [Mya arenaria]